MKGPTVLVEKYDNQKSPGIATTYHRYKTHQEATDFIKRDGFHNSHVIYRMFEQITQPTRVRVIEQVVLETV